jgi:response regulator NasT
MPSPSLHIVIVDTNRLRAAILEEGLREAGHARVTIIGEMTHLVRRIVEADPDVIFIDLENPNRDALEQMFQVSRTVRRPIAMFVDKADLSAIEAAIDAGVSTYIVDGLRKDRVKPILDVTVARFNAFNRLRNELDQARQALEERKVIDKAKGILMKSRNISEEEAYALLRSTAMSENRRLADVAHGLVTAARLLG